MPFKNTFMVLIFFSFMVCQSQDIKIMTYNIKYDNKQDTINNWNDRKEAMVALLKHYGPSFIGMQEVLFNQLEYLDESLPDYLYIGVGRDDGKKKGEYSPILYDAGKYNAIESNTFWLSETPDKISVGWDAAMERICTYGLFEDKATRGKLWVFNTHFDHIGDLAREKSAELIIRKIKEINTEGLPVALMGDFNLTPDKTPIHLIKDYMDDGREITTTPFYGPTGSFSGFDPQRVLDTRIDYIFVKNLKTESYIHIDDRMENNKHISDHLPVLISIAAKN